MQFHGALAFLKTILLLNLLPVSVDSLYQNVFLKHPLNLLLIFRVGGTMQGQARGIWTYHSSIFEIWLYHEGPTLQSRITQKWLELSLSFFHIMTIGIFVAICSWFDGSK